MRGSGRVYAYEEYSPSDIEWVASLPKPWETNKIKHVARVAMSNVDKHTVEGEVPVRLCNYLDVYRNGQITADMSFMSATASSEQIRRLSLHPGDVIITKDSEDPSDIGVPALVKTSTPDLVCGYHLAVLRPFSIWGGFLAHWLRSHHAKASFRNLANGLTRYALGIYEIDNLRIAVPSPPEQRAIATFLDRETAKIDTLIEKQQRLVELLAEKRQAVISHAVTKGLDASAPMKDIGVEWLGEVPERWKIKKLKHLATLLSGGTPSKENVLYWNGDVLWASAKDLKVDFLSGTEDHITAFAIESGAASLVAAESIIVVVRGMILAHTFPVSINMVPMCINQDLKAIKPSKLMTTNYLALLFKGTSAETLARVSEAGHGTKALRMDAWLNMELPVPTLKEQAAIVKYAEFETAKIDTLTAKANRSIALMRERRSALISAAVTGKIDVREAV